MNIHHQHSNKRIEYLKFFGVLLGIVALACIVVNISGDFTIYNRIRSFMSVFMIVFAVFKLAGYKEFVAGFPSYDLVAMRFKVWAYAFPFIELFLGALGILHLFGTARLWAVIAVMTTSALGVFYTKFVKKRMVHCVCLGNVIKLPLSSISLFENVLMVALAAVMLMIGP